MNRQPVTLKLTTIACTVVLSACAAKPVVREPIVIVAAPPADLVHTLEAGDMLGDLAVTYTGDIHNWQAIAEYNNIDDPAKIKIGDQIEIPADLLTEAARQEAGLAKVELVSEDRQDAMVSAGVPAGIPAGVPAGVPVGVPAGDTVAGDEIIVETPLVDNSQGLDVEVDDYTTVADTTAGESADSKIKITDIANDESKVAANSALTAAIGATVSGPVENELGDVAAAQSANPKRNNAADSQAATSPQTESLALTTDANKVTQPVEEAPVVLAAVTPVERFVLRPIKDVETGVIDGEPTVRVVGTYYPKGIYAEPATYADLLVRVAPGTLFPYEAEIDGWYEVVYEDGSGFIRITDAELVNKIDTAAEQ